MSGRRFVSRQDEECPPKFHRINRRCNKLVVLELIIVLFLTVCLAAATDNDASDPSCPIGEDESGGKLSSSSPPSNNEKGNQGHDLLRHRELNNDAMERKLEEEDNDDLDSLNGRVEEKEVVIDDGGKETTEGEPRVQTVVVPEDVLLRIHTKLQNLGLLEDDNSDHHKELWQKIAFEELQKWQQEEQDQEQERLARLEVLQERKQRLLEQQKHQQEPQQLPPFPYLGTPPPANLSNDFSHWKPPGGGRYTEYTDGETPYEITDELRHQSDELARARRPYIRQAMQFAWDGYRNYAYGMDEVRPQSKTGTNHWGGIGVTLVDSLDTLWIMNMTEAFWQARDYVRDHLSHNQNKKVSVFETTIRSLGGLLSAYDWSHDEIFLEEALDLARRLMKAFQNNSPQHQLLLPFSEINLRTGKSNMIPWTGGNAILSEFGTLQLEFRYLDHVVGTEETAQFRQKVETIFEFLHEISPQNGLFPYYMATKATNSTGSKASARFTKFSHASQPLPQFTNDHLTFGAMADSFYEYMLKIWIQGGRKETMYRTMYDKAMSGMHDELLHLSTPSGLTYLADKSIRNKRIHHKMDHLVCFVGGMLALGAYTDPLGFDSPRAQRDFQTAKALTYTCYQMYSRMKTGISPEYVEFKSGKDFMVGKIAPHYLLRPEAVESFYILNVLTGDPIYREWGWEVFQSIEKYCKTHVAYGSLGNVQDDKEPPRDDMESFFLAETLKYLYLLNDPDSEIDILNKHVFNTEAHPVRIFPLIDEEKRKRRLRKDG